MPIPFRYSTGSWQKKGLTVSGQALLNFGGAEGNRTPDLYNAIVALSQLSYGPIILGIFQQATDTYGWWRDKAREK